MSEDDISLIVEMVKAVATGELTYCNTDGFRQCPFCGMADLTHDLHCLVVRARQIEGAIEEKLRGVK